MDSNDPHSSPDKPGVSETSNRDVSAAVEDLLNTLSNKFASVSSEIFAKRGDPGHTNMPDGLCEKGFVWMFMRESELIVPLCAVDEMSRRLEILEAALQEGKPQEGPSKS
ncbi:hypothetical protein E4U41_005509 [Claviceps citrina]|nr:hypothetical protein E4U41_005509 [Claviceps citrina]